MRVVSKCLSAKSLCFVNKRGTYNNSLFINPFKAVESCVTKQPPPKLNASNRKNSSRKTHSLKIKSETQECVRDVTNKSNRNCVCPKSHQETPPVMLRDFASGSRCYCNRIPVEMNGTARCSSECHRNCKSVR